MNSLTEDQLNALKVDIDSIRDIIAGMPDNDVRYNRLIEDLDFTANRIMTLIGSDEERE